MDQPVSAADFDRVTLCVGTVLEVTTNSKARKPAYVLQIDFGPRGVRTTSAQLTQNYHPADLVGRQVVAVLDLPPKRVAGVQSQVLVLGGISPSKGVVLLAPDQPVENGTQIGGGRVQL